jgi:hypothetical protein
VGSTEDVAFIFIIHIIRINRAEIWGPHVERVKHGPKFPHLSLGLSFSTNCGASWGKSAEETKRAPGKAAPDSAGAHDYAISCSADLSWRKEFCDAI